MNIVQLVLAETGTYDPMMLRPYEALDSHRHVKTLQEVTRYGKNVSPEALSGAVGSILRPTANHLGQIEVANGWGTKRYRFFMRIRDTDLVGNQTEQLLTGFTDYDGGSFVTGAIDPRLRMYVTNTIRMKSLSYMTDFGRQSQTTIGSAAHVFNHRFIPSMENVGQSSINLQRPMDVFTTLQTQEFRKYGADNFFDPRTMFVHENVKLSNRSNALAPTYLSKLLQAGGASRVNADETDGVADIWGKAEGMVKENAYSQDEALFELHLKTSFCEGDSFTFSELQQLCPHLDSVTKLVPANVMMRAQQSNADAPMLAPYSAGQFDGWNGQDQHTVWATILSNSVPPLMLECMMANVGFMVHNHTINGEVDIKWSHAQPFAKDLDPSTSRSLLDNFGFLLQTQIIRDLLGGNPTAFSIVGNFDVLGESRLEIAIGGGVPVPFATPTFADALFTPVLTRGQSNVRKLADQIEFFTDNIMDTDFSFAGKTASPSSFMSTGNNYNASADTL